MSEPQLYDVSDDYGPTVGVRLMLASAAIVGAGIGLFAWWLR